MNQGLQPPAGYIGTPEAAEILGVHQQTIRNYVKDGKLEGQREYDADTNRERYWVKREAVEALLESRQHSDAVERADIVTRRTEEVVAEIVRQEIALKQQIGTLHNWLEGELGTIRQNQNDMLKELKRSTEILEETARRSREFQDEMLELKSELLDTLREEREYVREQRRGFWRRLFGG